MKYSEFMAACIDSYGEYKSEVMKKMTAVYIQERWEESELEAIFLSLITKLNSKYGKPVTPADFEEHFPLINLEAEANEWYNKLSATGTSLDNIIISDNRAEQALEAFGGWVCFCSRNPEYEGIHRKNFTESYIKAVRTDAEPKLIYGNSSRKYQKPALIFGDKEKCLPILNQGSFKQIDSDIFKRVD